MWSLSLSTSFPLSLFLSPYLSLSISLSLSFPLSCTGELCWQGGCQGQEWQWVDVYQTQLLSVIGQDLAFRDCHYQTIHCTIYHPFSLCCIQSKQFVCEWDLLRIVLADAPNNTPHQLQHQLYSHQTFHWMRLIIAVTSRWCNCYYWRDINIVDNGQWKETISWCITVMLHGIEMKLVFCHSLFSGVLQLWQGSCDHHMRVMWPYLLSCM